jgi:hypothetical protein
MQQDMTIIEAVNRTTKPLNFMFDGVPGVVHPGYKLALDGSVVPAGRDGHARTTPLTKTTAEYARRQNVKLGTEDRYSGEAEFLVGVADRNDDGTLVANPHWLFNDISYTEQGQSIERLNRASMADAARGARPSATSGFPRGREGAATPPFQYADGPVPTNREG